MIEQPTHVAEITAQQSHLCLLSLIGRHPEYSQRRLAEAMGVSLGKVHYLLMALLDKELVKVGKFSRTPTSTRNAYALTPAGVRHRLQLTRRCLHVKEREYLALKTQIEQMRAELDAHARDESGQSARDA